MLHFNPVYNFMQINTENICWFFGLDYKSSIAAPQVEVVNPDII